MVEVLVFDLIEFVDAEENWIYGVLGGWLSGDLASGGYKDISLVISNLFCFLAFVLFANWVVNEEFVKVSSHWVMYKMWIIYKNCGE